jgi:DNA-directed RNA polymerase specialized sigma24 family protein
VNANAGPLEARHPTATLRPSMNASTGCAANSEALDPEIAQMLTMRHRFGWTLRRIGNAVGLSPGAVDGRLGRTRDALRKQASEQFNDQ